MAVLSRGQGPISHQPAEQHFPLEIREEVRNGFEYPVAGDELSGLPPAARRPDEVVTGRGELRAAGVDLASRP